MSTDKELLDLLDQISQERDRGSKIRLGMLAAILLMFFIFGAHIYRKINNFDTQQLMFTLQENAAQRVWPAVHYELNDISDEVIPVITDSMQTELQNLGPKFSKKFQEESLVLETNLGNHLQSSLQRELDMKFAKHKDRLESKYKDTLNAENLSDDLIIRLQTKSQQWAHNKLDTIFQEHINTLQSLNESVLALQKEATRNKDGSLKKASMDDLVLITSELLNSRIGDK